MTKADPKVWFDSSRLNILNALRNVSPSFEMIARSDLEIAVRKQVTLPAFDQENSWSAQIITPYLLQVRECIENSIYQLVQSYPSPQWLWFIRRLPEEVLRGSLATTRGYLSALATVASGLSKRAAGPVPLVSGLVEYQINDKIARDLYRFLTVVSSLFDVHVSLRFAGKGATFRKPVGKRFLPRWGVSHELRQAIELYDKRVANTQTPFHRLGTEIAAPTKSLDSMMLVYQTIPGFVQAPLGSELVHVEAHFAPRVVSVDALRELNFALQYIAPELWSRDVLALATLLRGSRDLVASFHGGFAGLLQVGYLMLKESSFHERLAESWSDILDWQKESFPALEPIRETVELLEELKTMSGALWPLQVGPVVRQFEDGICLDLYAATNLLETRFEFPAQQGEVANVRARHFELAVQDRINVSSWKPPDKLLRLRGVALRLKGAELTDLDAIGAKNKTLVVVSCKSVIYSKDYDAGDYRVVRNIASNALESVENWSEIIKRLRENPVGDNYDLSDYTDFVGVVCTPTVVYVPIGSCTELAAENLSHLVTLHELGEWLTSH